jgi:hypothetical protein
MPKTKSTNRRFRFNRIEGQDLNVGKWTFTAISSTPSPGFTDTVVLGDNIRNWKFLISNGLEATTSLSGTRIVCKPTEGHVFRCLKPKSLNPSTLSDRYKYRADGNLIAFGVPGPADTGLHDEANRQAIVQFLKKCYEEQRAFQALVTFGELGEALRMIKSPAQSLRRGFQDYLNFLQGKKGRVPKNRKRTFLADTWLEYMYGWRPLVSDISSGYEAVTRYHHQLKPWKRVKGEGVAFGPMTESFGTETFAGGITISYRTRSRDEYHVKYYGLVTVLNPYGYLPNMRNWGADLRSFVPSLWELIPYSFLVDYFTDIGDVLSAFAFNQADLRWKVKGTKNSRIVETFDERLVPSTDPTFVTVADVGTPGKLRYSRDSVSRSSYTANLIPSFGFEIPGMSSLKWLNMAALARSQKRIIPF